MMRDNFLPDGERKDLITPEVTDSNRIGQLEPVLYSHPGCSQTERAETQQCNKLVAAV